MESLPNPIGERTRKSDRGRLIGVALLVLILIVRAYVIRPLTLQTYVGLAAYAIMAMALGLRWRLAPRILLIWFSLAAIGGLVAAAQATEVARALLVMAVTSFCIICGWYTLLKRGTGVGGLFVSVILIMCGHGLGLWYLPPFLQHR